MSPPIPGLMSRGKERRARTMTVRHRDRWAGRTSCGEKSVWVGERVRVREQTAGGRAKTERALGKSQAG